MLDKACLHHISVPVQSYFLILALHKWEGEQKKHKTNKKSNEAGSGKKGMFAPKPINFENSVRA